MNCTSIQMDNGRVFEGKKIGELTEFILNKFSEEKLTYDEAKIILKQVESIIGEYALIRRIN